MDRAFTAAAVGIASAVCGGCATAPSAPGTLAPEERIPPNLVQVAAADLECQADRVSATRFEDVLRAIGCMRIAYFLRRSETQWERVGPRFELSPEDFPRVPSDATGDEWTAPVRIAGSPPTLSWEQWSQLTAWEVNATAHCIVRIDGTLHHCIVIAPDPSVAQAISQSLVGWRFSPATFGGRPVPTLYRFPFRFRLTKPTCSQLREPSHRARCESELKRLEDSR